MENTTHINTEKITQKPPSVMNMSCERVGNSFNCIHRNYKTAKNEV